MDFVVVTYIPYQLITNARKLSIVRIILFVLQFCPKTRKSTECANLRKLAIACTSI